MKKQLFLPRLSIVLESGERLDYQYTGDPLNQDEMVAFEMKIKGNVKFVTGVITVSVKRKPQHIKSSKSRKRKR